VYACGQLGLGDKQGRDTYCKWQRAAVPGVVREVVAGTKHSLLLLETGEVYGCGDNRDGQLGLGDREDRNTWRLTRILTV
jgi:X-linked retinitis pigmentosa GTPase regulator